MQDELTLESVRALWERTTRAHPVDQQLSDACRTFLHVERYAATRRIIADAEAVIRAAMRRESR